MRERLWYELTQSKFNEKYTCFLIGRQRRILNYFNLFITIFSTAGVMGWKIWDKTPVVACVIIAFISLLKASQANLIPSDKQIEKLDKVADFYFDLFLKFEVLWFDFENKIITEKEVQNKFQEFKQTEREINKIMYEIHKNPNKNILLKAKKESDIFFNQTFNTQLL